MERNEKHSKIILLINLQNLCTVTQLIQWRWELLAWFRFLACTAMHCVIWGARSCIRGPRMDRTSVDSVHSFTTSSQLPTIITCFYVTCGSYTTHLSTFHVSFLILQVTPRCKFLILTQKIKVSVTQFAERSEQLEILQRLRTSDLYSVLNIS